MARRNSDIADADAHPAAGAPIQESRGGDPLREQESAPGHEAVGPELIPGWLALLILALLLAVAVLVGYILRGAFADDTARTPVDVAVRDWEQQAAADPEDPEALLALGYAYQQDGRYEDALDMYDAVLALDASNNGALYNKGMTLMDLGRVKDAETVLWDVLEVSPDHVLAAKALGEYYIGKSQFKSALVALEPVVEVRPEYADLQYLSGYACEQLDLRKPAVAYYRGALTYDPDYTEAKDGLDRLGATELEQ